MILERSELRERAARLMAMAICAETEQRHYQLREMSRVAQIGAGMTIDEDDPEVQRLVAEFAAEDAAEAEYERRAEVENPADRCPPRE